MRRTSVRSGLWVASLLGLAGVPSAGAADELIGGDLHVVEPASVARMVASPSQGSFDLPAGDPTIEGGALQIVDTGGASPPMLVSLPAAGWRGLGIPPGSQGYSYEGAGTPDDPCTRAVVSPLLIGFLCEGVGVTLAPPFAGSSGIVFTVGAGTRYCAAFGGTTIKNDEDQLTRVSAPRPQACAGGGGGTTSTSTSTSSTSSTTVAACCNNAMALSFITADVPGDCGDLLNASGALVTNLACSGLYTGGGGNSVPLPFAVPDRGDAVTAITSCSGQTATIGATTSTQVGGNNRRCTGAGCLFGAPLAVPNPNSTPTSVCVLNAVSANAAGSVACDTGATNLDIPLNSVIFLTGDVSTDPSSTITGIQPCPLCNTSTNTCAGGPNNGMACVAGTSTLAGNPSYPTSHDCPPDPMTNIGTLPVAFQLSSGTVTWTGTVATNDNDSSASPLQNRVFSGFCRDGDGTGGFSGSTAATAQHCWENGMAVGAACSGTFESCVQRNNGAFGPAGGNNRTITVIGNAMSILGGPATATLVDVFSVRPTFDATVDAAGDLPGPGAVSLPGTARLCSSPNPCP